MSLQSIHNNSEDVGYAADHKNSHQPERPQRKYFTHCRASKDDRTNSSLDSSIDSEEASHESTNEPNRCSTPCLDCCIGCQRPVDRCRCRLRRSNSSQYALWKRDLSRSFEWQCNAVELPEAISGNYTPSMWQNQDLKRLNRMLDFDQPPQHQPKECQPLYIDISNNSSVKWPENYRGVAQLAVKLSECSTDAYIPALLPVTGYGGNHHI